MKRVVESEANLAASPSRVQPERHSGAMVALQSHRRCLRTKGSDSHKCERKAEQNHRK